MAVRTWQTGGVDENWGTIGNWLEAAVPTASDDVTFPAATQSCTLNTSARVCKSIDFTNYADTITFSQTLTVSGNVTLGASMTFAGASALICNATATLTSNGKMCSVPLTLNTNVTYTLSDNWAVSGLMSLGTGSTGVTLNSNAISASGGIFLTCNSNGVLAGTTEITMTGGTLSGNGGVLRLSTIFAGNVTISGTLNFNTGTLTYSSGTITTTGSSLVLSSAATTLNTAGMTWNNVALIGTMTVTLSSDFSCSGTLTVGSSTTTTTINGSGGTRTITASGGLAHNNTSGNVTGSALLSLTGGTWSSTTGGNSGTLRLATTLAGDVTISGTVSIGGSLTYSSGTITTTGSTLACTTVACTLNVAAVTWNNLTMISTVTHVLSADVTATGLVTLGAATLPTTINGFTINAGSLSLGGTTSSVIGTTNVVMNGTGTWSSTQTGNGDFRLNLTINTAGTVTISGTVHYRTGTLTYTAGTVVTTGSTLVMQGASCTVNTTGMTWNSVTIGNAVTVTITASGTFTVAGTLTITGTAAAPTSLISSVGSTSAFLTISKTTGKTVVNHCTATDIDSSLGLSVFDYKGTLTRTKNWVTRKVLPRPVAA